MLCFEGFSSLNAFWQIIWENHAIANFYHFIYIWLIFQTGPKTRYLYSFVKDRRSIWVFPLFMEKYFLLFFILWNDTLFGVCGNAGDLAFFLRFSSYYSKGKFSSTIFAASKSWSPLPYSCLFMRSKPFLSWEVKKSNIFAKIAFSHHKEQL